MWSTASPFRAFRINLFAPDFTFIFFPLPSSNINVSSHGMVQRLAFYRSNFQPSVSKTATHGHSLQALITIARMPLQMFLLLFRASSHKNAVCQVENESITAMAQSYSVCVRLKMAAVNQ